MTKNKGISLIFLFLSSITPIIILYFSDFEIPDDESLYKKLSEQATLLSWIFTGIIGFVSFIVLFITFTFENKLVVAANTLKRIITPFGYNSKELKQALIDYNSLLKRDRILDFLFYVFLSIGSLVSIIWGTIVGFYTKFQLSLELELSLPSVVFFGIYAFWLILHALFILVGIIIYQVRFNKNPFMKGSLPTIKEVMDIEYIEKNGGDFNEFFSINYPKLDFYENPPQNNPTFELDFSLPIAMNHFQFVMKFYSNEKVILKCYGKLDNIVDYDNVGKSHLVNLSTDFKRSVYNELLSNDSHGELQIFNSNMEIISRFMLIKKVVSKHHFYYEFSRSIEMSGKNLDKGLLQNLTKSIEVDIFESNETKK